MRRNKALPGYWFDPTGGVYKFNGHYQSRKSAPQKGYEWNETRAWTDTQSSYTISSEGTAYHVLLYGSRFSAESSPLRITGNQTLTAKRWFNFGGEYLCHCVGYIGGKWNPSTLTGTTYQGKLYDLTTLHPTTLYLQDDTSGDKLWDRSADSFDSKSLWGEYSGTRSLYIESYAGGSSYNTIKGYGPDTYITVSNVTVDGGCYVSAYNYLSLQPYLGDEPFPGIVVFSGEGEDYARYIRLKILHSITDGTGYYIDLSEDDFDVLKIWYDNYTVTEVGSEENAIEPTWEVSFDVHVTGSKQAKYIEIYPPAASPHDFNVGGWADYNTENGSSTGVFRMTQYATFSLTYPTA